MPESYFQLPPSSAGDSAKLRYLQRTIGANDVHGGNVFQTAPATFGVVAETTCANNLQHLSIYNGSTDVLVYVKKLFIILRQESGITGGRLRFNVRYATNFSGGTDITPNPHDSSFAALPAEVLLKTGATVTEGDLLFPLTFTNDEMLLTQNSMAQQLMAGLNWMPEGIEVQDVVLRNGEGFTVRQLTNATGGDLAWYAVISVEPV